MEKADELRIQQENLTKEKMEKKEKWDSEAGKREYEHKVAMHKLAKEDYPGIIKKFEKLLKKDGSDVTMYVGVGMWNYLVGNGIYNTKMKELLEEDGFKVDWETCDGWEKK